MTNRSSAYLAASGRLCWAKKEGKPYRLPTEAEWEYACRAGTPRPFARVTADAGAGELRHHHGGKARTAAPAGGRFKANVWGLFDMHGNVAEWCHDWHGPYEAGEQTDPVGRADGCVARECAAGAP